MTTLGREIRRHREFLRKVWRVSEKSGVLTHPTSSPDLYHGTRRAALGSRIKWGSSWRVSIDSTWRGLVYGAVLVSCFLFRVSFGSKYPPSNYCTNWSSAHSQLGVRVCFVQTTRDPNRFFIGGCSGRPSASGSGSPYAFNPGAESQWHSKRNKQWAIEM